MTLRQYQAAVLHHYTTALDTPTHPRAPDRQLAAQLFAEGVPIETIKAALLLATTRRVLRAPDPTARLPIRSLSYFVPVIREIQAAPLDPAYLHMLADRLRRAGQTVSAAPPDTTTLNGEDIRR
jgi:hypothetical protein